MTDTGFENSEKARRGGKRPAEAVKEIKDSSILLVLGAEYLCQERMLKKMGSEIENDVTDLREYTSDLQKRLIGKPMEDVNLDEPINEILSLAKRLQGPEKTTIEACRKAQLGRELGSWIGSLADRIGTMEEKIEGRSVSFGKLDALRLMLAPAKWVVGLLGTSSRMAVRLAAVFVLTAIVAFLALFFTMEREQDVTARIERIQERIQSTQAAIPQVEEDLKEVQQQMKDFHQDELSRQEEVALMDLNVKAYELTERQEKLQADLQMSRAALKKNLETLKEIREKSLIERILRQ